MNLRNQYKLQQRGEMYSKTTETIICHHRIYYSEGHQAKRITVSREQGSPPLAQGSAQGSRVGGIRVFVYRVQHLPSPPSLMKFTVQNAKFKLTCQTEMEGAV